MAPFVPYQHAVRSPMAGFQPMAQPAVPQFVINVESITYPIGKQIDLLQMNGGSPGVPGRVYVRDFFLFHSTDVNIDRLLWSASNDVAQAYKFSLQLVTTDGEGLSIEQGYATLPKIGKEVIPAVFTPDNGKPVFLRVQSVYQTTQLYVTVEMITSKVGI
jgi:hypothetical protein